MATSFQIVEEIAREFGKDSREVKEQIEVVVGDVTIDVLSQNKGRFEGLRESTTITIASGDLDYVLPPEFNTIVQKCLVVDSAGTLVAEFHVVDEDEFYHRQLEARLESTRYGFVEHRYDGDEGPGYYLVLGGDWGETGYIKFFFYRQPLATDTDLIKNTTIVKTGVRKSFPSYIGQERAVTEAITYDRMKSGVKESPVTRTTGVRIRPTQRAQSINMLQGKAGRGE